MSYAAGIMSGTSLDGIDVAIVKIDTSAPEDPVYEFAAFESYPFEDETKKRIMTALSIDNSDVALICSLNFELGKLFGNAVVAACKKNNLASEALRFVASHGQTIYHHPQKEGLLEPSTLQIGESSVIAEIVKTDVVSDFRYRDMAVGGQGAPIVPYSEYILYRSNYVQRILQNIGGISNATIIPKEGMLKNVLAFDTGPGNMIIDELCQHFYQKPYDSNGSFAKQGSIHQGLLSEFMSHPFIAKQAPKTTGREEFGKDYVHDLLAKYQMPANDWIKTATLFTAKAIAEGVRPYVDKTGSELIIGGGGSYNSELVKMITAELPEAQVMIQEDIGFSSEAKEAVAMVILGHRTMERLPSNVPSATGAAKEVILGKITYY
ncbi:anhydro-N-acetylmuramic acid kinase [Vagococcus elongatus]|uniref:Anhydro-N-acetylmuramic acid kinase n=1 Tax=Vagococcus elongatus TaxID=180344 RepID=A0A430AL87_9ENTE|nr:anhydro-N-acetylmuramic acid kinase [Vagococcus elongatus]